MTKQISIIAYKFGELAAEVQSKVIEKFRENKYSDDGIIEDFNRYVKENLEEAGIDVKDKTLEYDFSYSKGYPFIKFDGQLKDGYVFLEKHKLLKKFEEITKSDIEIVEYIDGGKVLVNVDDTFFEEFEDDDIRQVVIEKRKEKLEQQREAFEKYLQEFVDNKISELVKEGVKYFEEAYSDETIKEDIEANDYLFNERGQII